MSRRLEDLQALRRERWGQTPAARVPDPAAAARLIARVGLATLFPASSEVPNVYHAHLGSPTAAVSPKHDSAAGRVFCWRWDLGRLNAGFYAQLVKKRPTWVSWDLLPAVLRLCAETRVPDELEVLGALSPTALRIVRVLEAAGEPLSTGDLRRRAGLQGGKEQRAAYTRAMTELESRLLLAQVFWQDRDDTGHALVEATYPEAFKAALALRSEDAAARLLRAYLPQAVYVLPRTLARHLGAPLEALQAGLARLAAQGLVEEAAVAGAAAPCYLWLGAA